MFGQAYPQYLQEKILIPLGMNSTTTTEGAAGMAQGNLTFFGSPIPYEERINQKYLVGCCGVISTVEDMGHYLIAQLNNGQYGEIQLVSLDSMRLMHTAPSGVEGFMGMQYGMGWLVEEAGGIKQIEDPGNWTTYASEMVLLPEQGYGIAIIYNQGRIAPSLTSFPTFREGAISLLNGREPASGVTLKTYGLTLSTLVLLTIGLEIYALARLPRWAKKASNLPVWRRILAIGLPIVEAGLLSFGFPYLVATMTAKTFVLKTALLWWTDLMG
ncbi:MAG TPA: serine hydrolase domain-containing protein [Anaerolineales bacterium]|nr:serine hydrolase domain-containing protein [Anaerolineales bacterium]